MDQHKGAGHHAITAAAVHELFAHAHQDGKVLGLTEAQFYERLDHWQGYADRSPLGWREGTPTGLGNTWMPSWMYPDIQRAHSMADPHKSGDANLKDVQQYVLFNLMQAKEAHGHQQEWECLGSAVHALEDSYSGAHVFRDPDRSYDPHAPILAFNNFAPGGSHQTHDSKLDQVPLSGDGALARSSDWAAAFAVAEVLQSYLFARAEPDYGVAQTMLSESVSACIQGEGVQVFTDKTDPAYLEMRGHQYANEQSINWAASTPAEGGPSSIAMDPASHEPNYSANDGTAIYIDPYGHMDAAASISPEQGVAPDGSNADGGAAEPNFTDDQGHQIHVDLDGTASHPDDQAIGQVDSQLSGEPNYTDEYGNAVHIDMNDSHVTPGDHGASIPSESQSFSGVSDGPNYTDEHGEAVHLDAYGMDNAIHPADPTDAGSNVSDDHGASIQYDAYDHDGASHSSSQGDLGIPDDHGASSHADATGHSDSGGSAQNSDGAANYTDEHGAAIHVDAYDSGGLGDHFDSGGLVDDHGGADMSPMPDHSDAGGDASGAMSGDGGGG